ncbi:MAG: hypothetical protein QF473_00375 [Planctomycetota bacterium]|nr:hypothetical protein [Planctomycetota bacterium]MDP7129456.1 hypothetical protein [Planctomycetota bacterium]MDP7250385.1 hypothetical protein [Planctomycetota bacterium]
MSNSLIRQQSLIERFTQKLEYGMKARWFSPQDVCRRACFTAVKSERAVLARWDPILDARCW